MKDIAKIDFLLKHIQMVQYYIGLMGKALIAKGEIDLGKRLIANGMLHDNSKFFGVEWEHLSIEEDPLLGEAISHHQQTNPHHPEYWGGIEFMPKLYILEMICDWKARSTEFGTDFKEWIEKIACKRYKIKKNSDKYNLIFESVELILEKPF